MTTTTTDRAGRVGDVAIKAPVVAATTAPITLSGEQTIDGVLTAASRVLVKSQASSIDNGIYLSDTGTWTRAADWDGPYDAANGTLVHVNGGTANSGFWYAAGADPIVVGTSAVTWARSSSTLAIISAYAQTLLDDATAAVARATLGSTAVGDALFIAATAAAARAVLVLNTGTASGEIPVLDTAGKLVASVHERAFQPLSASVASSALTATLAAGARLEFSDGTGFNLAASISVTASSGSTLGTTSGVASRLWVVALKNAGTPELAIINTWDGTNIFEILPTDLTTTVAEGGAGAADSAQVFYSTTLRAAQAIAIVGYIESTQATAGTWATSPSLVQGFGPGVPLPGQIVQTRRQQPGDLASGSTATPMDDTIPQITEGTEFLNRAITPRSAMNLLNFDVVYFGTNAAAVLNQTVALHQVGVNNALAAVAHANSGTNQLEVISLRHRQVSGSAAALTFTVRAGNSSGSTSYSNGDGTGRRFGGVGASSLTIQEIMR